MHTKTQTITGAICFFKKFFKQKHKGAVLSYLLKWTVVHTALMKLFWSHLLLILWEFKCSKYPLECKCAELMLITLGEPLISTSGCLLQWKVSPKVIEYFLWLAQYCKPWVTPWDSYKVTPVTMQSALKKCADFAEKKLNCLRSTVDCSHSQVPCIVKINESSIKTIVKKKKGKHRNPKV